MTLDRPGGLLQVSPLLIFQVISFSRQKPFVLTGVRHVFFALFAVVRHESEGKMLTNLERTRGEPTGALLPRSPSGGLPTLRVSCPRTRGTGGPRPPVPHLLCARRREWWAPTTRRLVHQGPPRRRDLGLQELPLRARGLLWEV